MTDLTCPKCLCDVDVPHSGWCPICRPDDVVKDLQKYLKENKECPDKEILLGWIRALS
jgi:hypothetical protein